MRPLAHVRFVAHVLLDHRGALEAELLERDHMVIGLVHDGEHEPDWIAEEISHWYGSELLGYLPQEEGVYELYGRLDGAFVEAGSYEHREVEFDWVLEDVKVAAVHPDQALELVGAAYR